MKNKGAEAPKFLLQSEVGNEKVHGTAVCDGDAEVGIVFIAEGTDGHARLASGEGVNNSHPVLEVDGQLTTIGGLTSLISHLGCPAFLFGEEGNGDAVGAGVRLNGVIGAVEEIVCLNMMGEVGEEGFELSSLFHNSFPFFWVVPFDD